MYCYKSKSLYIYTHIEDDFFFVFTALLGIFINVQAQYILTVQIHTAS